MDERQASIVKVALRLILVASDCADVNDFCAAEGIDPPTVDEIEEIIDMYT